MEINFKKGTSSDITIHYGEGITESPLCLVDLCQTNNITCQRSSLLPKNAIKFFINPLKVRKSTKKKKDVMSQQVPPTQKTPVTKPSSSFSSILSKYNVTSNSQSIPKLFDLPKRDSNTEGMKSKLVIVYIYGDRVADYLRKVSEQVKKSTEAGVKHIFLLEGVKSAVRGKAHKYKKKVFAQENGHGQPTTFLSDAQLLTDEDSDSSIAAGIESLEDFELKLMSLTGHTAWEYEFTQTSQESLTVVQRIISTLVYSKYKAETGEFDVRGQTHSSEANFSGVNDVYSLMWIDMLMSVPGISEKKALSVFNQYPTMKKLMNAYESQLEESNKQKMLMEIQVSNTFDMGSKARNFGPSLSKKMYAVFQSEKEKQLNKLLQEEDFE